MQVQPVNKSNISYKGLYFTKASNVLFNRNPNVKILNPTDVIRESENGFRFVEDRVISSDMKERFKSNPFIKSLAERYDTFVFFNELPKEHANNITSQHLSYARIMWAGESKPHAEHRIVIGNSAVSQEYATNNMFKNLEGRIFSEIA